MKIFKVTNGWVNYFALAETQEQAIDLVRPIYEKTYLKSYQSWSGRYGYSSSYFTEITSYVIVDRLDIAQAFLAVGS